MGPRDYQPFPLPQRRSDSESKGLELGSIRSNLVAPVSRIVVVIKATAKGVRPAAAYCHACAPFLSGMAPEPC